MTSRERTVLTLVGAGAAAGAVGVGGAAALRAAAVVTSGRLNGVRQPPPYLVDAQDRRVHDGIDVVDLHADSLLWRRDLRRRGHVGHVDLPRLREAGVALQVFAAVTAVPARRHAPYAGSHPDAITALAVANGWPPRTWRSRLQRALFAAERLDRLAAADGRMVLVRRAADVDLLLARRLRDPGVLGALVAVEGSHALDGRLAHLDDLFDAGYRMLGLQHFFDNRAGGAADGLRRHGLTAYGRELVRRAQDRRMIVDVAHSSPAVVSDVLSLATAPVIASHTGVRGTCDNPRNLSDEQLRGIAATGGMIGVAMFRRAVGGAGLEEVARAIRYAADLVGVAHVGLGSDFDGAVTTPTDVTGLPMLTAALRRHGFDAAEISSIMGGTALRLFRRILP